MTLIDDIARMEAAAKSHFTKPEKVEEPTREPLTDKIVLDPKREPLTDKIVLDPKLDPDPYGYHGISLSDRLKAMGWP